MAVVSWMCTGGTGGKDGWMGEQMDGEMDGWMDRPEGRRDR